MQNPHDTFQRDSRLTKIEKIFATLGTLLLVVTFFLPLWRIEIWAPQYPEGLSMTIHLSRMEGNIDQINILNHYIGMKAITPEAIPEMKFMPYVVAVLVALGVITSLIASRWMAATWFGTTIIAAVAGLYDFYKWGYDYGHNLSPDAPIKVPGMTYQPPLIGGKTILNIDAYSWPDLGGIALGIAILCIFLAFAWSRLPHGFKKRIPFVHSFILVFLLLLGCTSKPEPIQVNVDSCGTCKMQIADLRFGGEVITNKGRMHKFDSIPCMVNFYNTNKTDVKSVWVLDYFAPGEFIDASKAHFLSSAKIMGPMGYGILASSNADKVKELQKEVKGDVLTWAQVLALNTSP